MCFDCKQQVDEAIERAIEKPDSISAYRSVVNANVSSVFQVKCLPLVSEKISLGLYILEIPMG
jgi:hypothetical protein